MIESATYDIAVSFAEDQRTVATEVARACRERGLTVLEGNDPPPARVRFIVPFVSTVDDVHNGDGHVLPVLTGEEPDNPHVAYLRADEHLVDILVSRVEAAETEGRGRVPVGSADTADTADTVDGEDASLRQLAEQFAAAPPALTQRGLAGTVHLNGSTIAVSVDRTDNTVYAVEVREDAPVNFVVLGEVQLPALWQRIEAMLSSL
ncbi:hypothetical protein [Lentzea sp. NBRC 102530]|uniref:hypothetical protein n=1 Tax=Lentzea sp. NBRC 102530 TaxID=3032201 RepID=UPI0024A19293|nr:hypothetical protein [Lentzea sp. NBRC 102530]GLY50858.1 hypothetical protein Lesp01_45140 [Lentzea sp. NBRC 102530]